LEIELGGPLFDRGRPIKLTHLGGKALPLLRDGLNAVELAEAAIRKAANDQPALSVVCRQVIFTMR
jgi:DNA-binding transcriptional LysR family regulator